MKGVKIVFFALFTVLCINQVEAEQFAYVHLPGGDVVAMEIHRDMKACDLAKQVGQESLGIFCEGFILHDNDSLSRYEGREFWLVEKEYAGSTDLSEKKQLRYRHYFDQFSNSEYKDLRFILKTLATKSLASLWGYKSQLEYAGDRIDHIHPLQFLATVFCHEELKAYIHAIRKRGSWVWGEFIKGLRQSLQEEAEKGNISDEEIRNFVDRVELDAQLVYEHIQNGSWEKLVKVLLVYVPRDEKSGRYGQ